MQKIFLSFIITFIANSLAAQIASPTLRCVKRDTVIWDIPNVSCGAFNSYLLFASRNQAGPYQLLATVSNPNTTRFYHANANGGTWFYYMQSNFNCTGQTRRSSDTVSNQPPELNKVLAVSVTAGNVGIEIRWRRNPSPQVRGYIVYRQTPLGLVPIDTVRHRDSVRYVDTRGVQPALRTEQYQVLAIDDCGTTSLFDSSHTSILLRTSQDICARTITLRWNLYRHWQPTAQRHEIWVGVNGRNPYRVTDVGGSDSMYIFRDLNLRARYVFFIRAVQGLTNITARSNEVVDTAKIVEPVRRLFIKNITVTERNKVQINWLWNEMARIDSLWVLRATQNGAYEKAIRQKIIPPIEDENIVLDNEATPSVRPYFYRLQTLDDCDSTFFSANYGNTIHLLGKAQAIGQLNTLTWSPLEIERGEVLSYQLYRVSNGLAEVVGLPLDTTKRREVQDVAQSNETNLCYYVEGKYRLNMPDGTTAQFFSRSNTLCLDQKVNIFIPNAFTPDGKNPEFRPLITFLDNVESFEMLIFDRWGRLLFRSTNPTEGWNGQANGERMPQGAYAFRLQVTQRDGEVLNRQGILTLIR
jgi:gliding motility-associated-like protein